MSNFLKVKKGFLALLSSVWVFIAIARVTRGNGLRSQALSRSAAQPKVLGNARQENVATNADEVKAQPTGKERTDYLIECFRLAHEEGMMRIRNRDNWLKLQLLAQVTLLAIYRGIEISGIKSTQAFPDVLVLAPIVSAIFFTLYIIENSLIGYLSRYVASISQIEQYINNASIRISNWDASDTYLTDYMKSTLRYRTLVQSLVFFFLPLGISAYRFYSSPYPWSRGKTIELIVNSGFLIYVLYLIWRSHMHRIRVMKNINRVSQST